MNIADSSLTVVLLGDWNKLYMQPDWVANNIFCKPEMEIGVEAQGIDVNVSYKCDGIIINPSQEKVVFTAANTKKETIGFLCQYATNYLCNAKTPYLSAYGLNIEFIETDDMILPEVFDNIMDTQELCKLNYTIINSQIQRTLKKDDKIINIQYSQEEDKTKIHFNEHHGEHITDSIVLDYQSIFDFIETSKEIVNSLGYCFEENENE